MLLLPRGKAKVLTCFFLLLSHLHLSVPSRGEHIWLFLFPIRRYRKKKFINYWFYLQLFLENGQPVCLCFFKEEHWEDLGGKFLYFEDWEPRLFLWDIKNWIGEQDIETWDLLNWQLWAERDSGDHLGVSFQSAWNKQNTRTGLFASPGCKSLRRIWYLGSLVWR